MSLLRKENALSASEIAARIEVSRQALHRLLKTLTQTHQIKKMGRAPHVTYCLPDHCASSNFGMELEIVAPARDILRKLSGVTLVTLFGSQARGTANASSDVDLLVWVSSDSGLGRKEVWDHWDRYATKLSWKNKASLVVFPWRSQIELHTLLLDLPEEHILVFDRDKNFAKLKKAVMHWRRVNGAIKIPSFNSKHFWSYAQNNSRIHEIDFILRLEDVA